MRKTTVTAATCAFLLAGCTTIDGRVEGANWEGNRLTANMPDRALAAGQEGVAYLLCSVDDSAAMTGCFVLRESPEGWQFGEAALRMHRQLRAREAYNGSPLGDMGGRTALVPVVFCMPEEPGASACRARYRPMTEKLGRDLNEAIRSLRAKDCERARRHALASAARPLIEHVETECARIQAATGAT